MHVVIDLYNVEIDLEKLKSFYASFPTQNWNLVVLKFGKEEIFSMLDKTNKTQSNPKNKGECQTQLLQFGLICAYNREYNISLIRTSSSIDIVFDKFYSMTIETDLLEKILFELIAKLHGYEACECSGFTVKDKEGNKLKPKEVIYIQNKSGIVFPKSFTYYKPKFDKKQVKSLTNQFNVYCPSPILKSILSNTSLNFVNDGVLNTLSFTDSKYFLNTSNLERVEMYSLERKKIDEIEDWLKKNKNKFASSLHKTYIDKKLDSFSFKALKKAVSKDIDYLQKFFTIVPVFNDERDACTNQIIKSITRLTKNEKVKKETDYLTIKKKNLIERTPILSLKEWEKNA
ncbi:hypothetical protein NBO_464g0007 [Nosema bombycis CQ1]|uniref:Uncharacterized protein n=1 Tax=Nosema bombycis (strain CQ1 / CVCC 102059) TaxID=578461 RepID=R0ME19_NOSB1|nr:hypothetical protein NBO_464g0007 [Nosema bombycis CQ1]|eukprot:EOB12320.1 hypothetical protein NBO_464g0007 [Nosema bombycis CQ1]